MKLTGYFKFRFLGMGKTVKYDVPIPSTELSAEDVTAISRVMSWLGVKTVTPQSVPFTLELSDSIAYDLQDVLQKLPAIMRSMLVRGTDGRITALTSKR